MTNDTQSITAALARRFARAGAPQCPEAAWRVDLPRRKSASRYRLAYAAAALAIVAIASVSAEASSVAHENLNRLMVPFASTEPLTPFVHAADRLTIAQAQAHVPFTIVTPAGLPANTRFFYADVMNEEPAPRVELVYETHLGPKYYRISIQESTIVSGPPEAHFNVQFLGGHTIDWTLPKIRWKHGAVTLDLFDWELPGGLNERIVRANS